MWQPLPPCRPPNLANKKFIVLKIIVGYIHLQWSDGLGAVVLHFYRPIAANASALLFWKSSGSTAVGFKMAIAE